jgi:hypothetical protein
MIIGLSKEQKLDKKNFEDNFRNSWYYNNIKNLDYESYENSIDEHHFWRRDYVENIYDGEVFWYLKNIFEDQPNIIYDIGCGNNFFKIIFGKYFNIISLDVDGDKADQIIEYKNWFKKNKNKIKHAYAINSIHFNCNFLNFTKILESFVSLFEKDGMGFVTLNFYFLIQNTSKEKLIELFGTDKFNQANFELFIPHIETKLKKFVQKIEEKIEFKIVEIDKKIYRNHINGNIRLLFKVKTPI